MKGNARFLSLLAFVCVAGCVGGSEPQEPAEVGEIQRALEQDDGGFDTTDTEPMFGDEAAFAAAGLDAEDPEVADPVLAYGPEAGPEPGAEDAGAITVLVLWGHLRPDLDRARPREWSGELHVTSGGLVLRRTIHFDQLGDAVLPRTDRQTIAFTSVTLPHDDGLLVSVVPPRAGQDGALAEEAPELVIRFEGVEEIVVSAADLADGYRAVFPVDAERGGIAVTTLPSHPCPHGLLAGIWTSVRPELGTFRGRWVGLRGELRGHVRGIWGANRAGRRVLFGKYIGNGGEFRGLLRGVYGDGTFTGVFVDRGGAYVGGLAGRYSGLDSDLPGDGIFAGEWIEACEAERCGPEGECPGLDPSVPGAGDLP